MSDFTFTARLWKYPGKVAWHFVTLPKDESERIKFLTQGEWRGWGSVRVTASVGRTTWKTSVFPDKKADAYLLPVKADVRRKEGIEDGSVVTVSLTLSPGLFRA
jgi:hypothetical protein